MIICPDCRNPLASLDILGCARCNWNASLVDDIPVFLSSADLDSELFSRYRVNYDQIAADDLDESIQPASYVQSQAERLHGHLGDVRGRRVCDVGIGQGVLFERLRASAPESLTGVDISAAYLSRAAPTDSVRVVMANAENLPFRAEFDLIVAADVAEHVLNVSDLLMSVREALVDGGTLALRVPYKDNMTQYARLNGCQYEMVHLRNFAKDNLTDLLSHFGFKVRSLHYDGFAPYRVRRYLVRTRVGRRLTLGALRRMPAGPDGSLRINPRLGRCLTTPLEITAIAQKAGRLT